MPKLSFEQPDYLPDPFDGDRGEEGPAKRENAERQTHTQKKKKRKKHGNTLTHTQWQRRDSKPLGWDKKYVAATSCSGLIAIYSVSWFIRSLYKSIRNVQQSAVSCSVILVGAPCLACYSHVVCSASIGCGDHTAPCDSFDNIWLCLFVVDILYYDRFRFQIGVAGGCCLFTLLYYCNEIGKSAIDTMRNPPQCLWLEIFGPWSKHRCGRRSTIVMLLDQFEKVEYASCSCVPRMNTLVVLLGLLLTSARRQDQPHSCSGVENKRRLLFDFIFHTVLMDGLVD